MFPGLRLRLKLNLFLNANANANANECSTLCGWGSGAQGDSGGMDIVQQKTIVCCLCKGKKWVQEEVLPRAQRNFLKSC